MDVVSTLDEMTGKSCENIFVLKQINITISSFILSTLFKIT